MSYDAESRMIGVAETGASETIGYDGAGNRVQKAVNGGATTVYVYDAFGVLSAEYSSGTVGTPPCATCYLSMDQVGSTRLVTDGTGNVVARHDFLPFGQEITSTGARTSQWYATGDMEQKFTGQLLDTESGLDYFTARYYTSGLQRFNSPDPANAGADLTSPPSWNGYAYVGNSPLSATDPTGLTVTCSTDANGKFSCYDDDPQPGGGGGSAQPPDLESTCWWCWEYGIPYYGNSSSAGSSGAVSRTTGYVKGDVSSLAAPPGNPNQKNCPSVPQHPANADVNANMSQTNAVKAVPLVGGSAATTWLLNASAWLTNICCWTSAWNYNAQSSSYDDFGNFNFGATGTALGLPSFVLNVSAGAAKNFNYWSKGKANPYSKQPYTNNPRKMRMISQGIQYARNGCS